MFRHIRRFFRRLFRTKPIVTRSTVERREDNETSYKVYTVALIPGHTEKKPNAKAYNGTREFPWNKDVIDFIAQKYKGKIKLVFPLRGNGRYKSEMRNLAEECDDLGVDLAIELHYDAAGVPSARGAHFRTNKGDKDSKRIALDFMKGYLDRFVFMTQRHNGCKEMRSGDAGYWFNYYMRKHGIESMLFEGFFSDYKTEESAPFLELDGHKLMAHYWIAELDKLEAKLNL